jgi:hypothetical protein
MIVIVIRERADRRRSHGPQQRRLTSLATQPRRDGREHDERQESPARLSPRADLKLQPVAGLHLRRHDLPPELDAEQRRERDGLRDDRAAAQRAAVRRAGEAAISSAAGTANGSFANTAPPARTPAARAVAGRAASIAAPSSRGAPSCSGSSSPC